MAVFVEVLFLLWLAALVWSTLKFARSVQDLRAEGRRAPVLTHPRYRARVPVRHPAAHFSGVHPGPHVAGAHGVRRG